jgi:hypothetical protein
VRALSRPPWHPRFAALHPGIVTQAAFGRFCATCERHLPEGGIAWLATTAAPLEGNATEADWPGVLLLCRLCAAAGSESAGTHAPQTLLPDRDTPFSPTAPADLAYELREIAVVSDGEPATVERVVVVPRSPAGAATIRRFALNTPYYDPAADALRLPPGAELALIEDEDPRLVSRTTAWWQADRAANALAEAPSPARDAIAETIAWGISFHGHWSVWATVLLSRPANLELVDALQHHPFFPGTRVV